LLDEEAAAPAEDVRADDVLHRVEDARMADQIVEPGEQQMRLLPQRTGDAARTCLVVLQPAAQARGLGGRDPPQRRGIPLVLIELHDVLGESLHRLILPAADSLRYCRDWR